MEENEIPPEDEEEALEKPSGGEPAQATGPVRAPRRRRLLPILAIVVAVVVIGAVGAYVLTANGTITAAFTYSAVDTHLSVNAGNSSDSDGDALTFNWTWGDGAFGTGVTASHTYASAGVYTVVLTARDPRQGTGSTTQVITLRILPTPFFLARQQAMTTTFDASGSTGSPGHAVTSYAWNYGDGATGSGMTATHTYAAPGRYTVSLNVTDDAGLTNTATRYVSANTTTVDVLGSQFFTSGCPHQDYWYLRHNTYGDVILPSTVRCGDFYPWILYARNPQQNPSWLYTLWRVDILATHNLGYNVMDPVYLPVFNTSAQPAADSFIDMNLTFNYLNKDSNLSDPLNINYWDTTAWAINPKYSDGYGYLLQGNITMDLAESRRIFGVQAATPAEAQTWWYTNTLLGRQAGPVEVKMGQWLSGLGNGKYYTYNAFQWQYEADITDLNATVAPDGTTTIHVFWDGWGYDVLFDRMSYWGAQNYSAAVNAPYGGYPPRGWMPFETCWCENTTINATIRNALDMHYQGTSEYWFGAVGNPGRDGLLNTSDDLPGWSWSPNLMDYVPPQGSGLLGASTFPDSELRWYETSTNMITTPGSYGYGTQYEYMVTPARWNMSLGNTITLVMPRFPIPWFDPVKSHWDPAALANDYVFFNATLTLRLVTPAGRYSLWDDRAKIFSLAAPTGFHWPDSGLPLNPEPYIEFGPESLG